MVVPARNLLVALVFCGMSMHAGAATVLQAGPLAAPGIRAVASLTEADFAPGVILRLHAGHYTAPILVPVSGTQASPIVIEGANDGGLLLDGPFVFDHAAFITLRGLHIDAARDAAIVVRRLSHDIIIERSTIKNAKLGVWIGDGAGINIIIQDMSITGSALDGIAVDAARATQQFPGLITRNRIENSGVHGIELSGNYYHVLNNTVTGSGRLHSGASGIHVFARNAQANIGRFNIIAGNEVFRGHDAVAQDGNGIQLDQWCDDNAVTGNIVAFNDGAGISVFDAARARITGNTLYGNMRDPGHSHRHKAELVFATDDTHNGDNTRNDAASDNIAVATNPAACAVLVDVPTASHPPLFSHDLLFHATGGAIACLAGQRVASLTAWNTGTPHTSPDVQGDPGFTKPTETSRASFAPHGAASGQHLGAVYP